MNRMQKSLIKGLIIGMENISKDELNAKGIVGILKFILKEEERVRWKRN